MGVVIKNILCIFVVNISLVIGAALQQEDDKEKIVIFSNESKQNIEIILTFHAESKSRFLKIEGGMVRAIKVPSKGSYFTLQDAGVIHTKKEGAEDLPELEVIKDAMVVSTETEETAQFPQLEFSHSVYSFSENSQGVLTMKGLSKEDFFKLPLSSFPG